MLRPRAAVLSICVLAMCLLAVPAQGAVSPHSLRKPVTDENFYFVMADRFENGDAANDHGGIDGRQAARTGSIRPPRASTTAAT